MTAATIGGSTDLLAAWQARQDEIEAAGPASGSRRASRLPASRGWSCSRR